MPARLAAFGATHAELKKKHGGVGPIARDLTEKGAAPEKKLGAVLGAAVSRPRDAGAGAVIGAVAGAVLGAASDNSRQRAADAEQARLDEIQARRAAQSDAQLQSYRRALKACLEGRGYTVE